MNITIKKTPALYTWAFWRLYLVHMRPYLFFVSGIAGLAGMTVYEQFKLGSLYNILVLLAFFFSYGFGQALTDCYQTDTDQISSPYRPLCQGLLTIRQVKMVSITGLVIVTFILVFHSWMNILFCLLSMFGLWSYTYFKKHFWFAGPLYNAWIVSLLALMGFVAASGVRKFVDIDLSIFKTMLITFLGYSNFVLIGYLKDISADQKTNYHTFPVIFGWDKSIWVADGIYVIMGIVYFMLFQHNAMSIIFGVSALIIGFSGLLHGHFTKEKIESNAAYTIISTIRAFLLIHFGMICSEIPVLWIFCLVFYLFFELIIYFRPVKMQI